MKAYFYQRKEKGVRAKEWSYKIPKKLRALPAKSWPEGFRMHGTLWTSRARSETYVNQIIQEAVTRAHEIRMGRMPASTDSILKALEGFEAWGRVSGGARREMGWAPEHAQHVISNCKRWIARLGLKSPADIQQPAFRREIVKMRTLEGKGGAGLAPNTVNHKAWALMTWCAWMVEEKLLPAMPITYKNLDRTPRAEKGKFSPDEVAALIRHSPREDAIIYHTAYVTSYRKTSISKIRAGFLDWAALTVGLHYLDNKNRKKTMKPMPPRLAATFWELAKGKGPDDVVLDWFNPKQANKRLRRNMVRAGVPLKDDHGRVRSFHSFKGSFGSALDTLGEDPAVIQRALDHADFKQTLVYIKRDLAPMRAAATTVEAALYSSATPRNEKNHDFSTEPGALAQGGTVTRTYGDGVELPHPPPAIRFIPPPAPAIVRGGRAGPGTFGFIFSPPMRMLPNFLRRRSGSFLGLPFAAGLLALSAWVAPAGAAQFTINGTNRLDTYSAAVPSSGGNFFRFTGKGYETPGSLSLTNNGSDSLVFERAEPSDSALVVDNILLHLQGQRGKVVFRGLALRIKSSGALFDSNQAGNLHLLFDSCTFLGDSTAPGKAIAWGGDKSSIITIRNSRFAFTGPISLSGASSITVANSMFLSTGPLTLSSTSGAGSVSLSNNLFSSVGLVSATVTSHLGMEYNTANRTQFLLDGNFSANCGIRNNDFAYPPAKNSLPQGGASRYATFLKGGSFDTAGTSVRDNVRDSSWDGFEYVAGGGATLFSDPGNAAVHTAKDPGTAWDWRIAEDHSHGAWNGTNPLPIFNLFPANDALSLPVPGGQAVLRILPSSFPRFIDSKFGTVPDSVLPASVRPWFGKENSLLLTGDAATVVALTLPARSDSGTPQLYIRTASGFVATNWNPSGAGTLANPTASAREFVPALGDQKVSRGTDVLVPGPAPATPLFLFPKVTRAGMIAFSDSADTVAQKRVRILRSGAKYLTFGFRTNAEGSDSVRFGVPSSLVTAFLPESLFFRIGRSTYQPAKDSLGKYWGSAAISAGNPIALVERLSVDSGADTLRLPQGATVVTRTAVGHQIKVDSSFRPSRFSYPDMGSFSTAYAFSWPGRANNDQFSLILPRADTLQKVFARTVSSTNGPYSAEPAGGLSIKIGIPIGDSLISFFLARKFRIPGGIATDLALGQDSVKGLLSSRPGDLALNPRYSLAGLDTARYGILALRGIVLDSLVPQGQYRLLIAGPPPGQRDSLHAFIRTSEGWDSAVVGFAGGRYGIAVDSAALAVAIVEGLTREDQNPVQPDKTPKPVLLGDLLTFKPELDASERKMYPEYRIDLLSLDAAGNVKMDTSGYFNTDSAMSLELASNRLYAYRVRYRTRVPRFSPDDAWIPLEGKQPPAESLQAAIPERAALRQHLIGFPFDASFPANVLAGFEAGGTAKSSLRKLNPDGAWEKLASDEGRILKRGEGYLFAADKPFRLKVGSPKFGGLAPVPVELPAKGWHLISNPFPMRLPKSAIRFDSGYVSLPLELMRREADSARKAPSYEWSRVTDELRPFEGYLIYAYRPTRIVVDPMASLEAAAKSASRQGAAGASEATVTLRTPWGPQSAVLYRSGPYLQTPYMPPWSDEGELPRFRVGAGGGWMYRKVDRLDSLAEEIEITVPEKGVYNLSVSRQDGDAEPVRLVDWGTGAVLDEAAMQALALDQGTARFTLLKGKAVAPGLEAFERMLPAGFSLDQNYPNPFRGSTRIRIGIPAGAGRVAESRVRVLSMDGRVMVDRSLGSLGVGSHFLTLGSDSWRPGVYLYEVDIRTDRRAISMRKKMIYGAMIR